MRIRMKLSYMALEKEITIKELFFEAILKTFEERKSYTQNCCFKEWDEKFF